MRTAAAFAFAATFLLAQDERTPIHSVTAVRIWEQPDATRVVVEVSGSFEFKYDRLHNPERVYFDVKGASPRIEGKRSLTRSVQDRVVQRIRVAETNPGVTRIVLDVAGPVDISPSQLTNPNRLIIELRLLPPGSPTTETRSVPGAPSSSIPKTDVAKADPPSTPMVPAADVPKPDLVKSEKGDLIRAEPGRTDAPVTLSRTGVPADRSELARAARRNSPGGSSLTRALGLKLNRIVLDAGHGGHDTGTLGPKGLQEKEVVLDVTLGLGKLIAPGLSAEVVYTRPDDTFVPLTERPAIANEKKADLFLSVHANSSPAPRITGVETYYLNFTDSKEAMDLAARENAGSQQSIFDLESLAKKIALHEKLDESREFAGRMQAAMFAFSARSFPGQKNR